MRARVAWTILIGLPLCVSSVDVRAEFVPTSYGWLYEVRTAEGRPASSDRSWEPLARVDALPKGVPERFEVWTRRKDGPVCLKALQADGSQREVRWTWGAPVRWHWQKAAEIGATDAPKGLLVIKNGDRKTVWLDAVAIVTNAELAAAAFAPKPEAISVRVDWGMSTGRKITRRHWAVNDYEVVKTDKATEAFSKAFAELSPAFVRVHFAGLADRWTLPENRDWDYAKIRRAFASVPAYAGLPLMVNVPTWPEWMSKEPVLGENDYAELTSLCERLARFFYKDLGVKELYLEVLNERDGAYEKKGRLADLWKLLSQIMDGVHKTVPGVKVGGPALTWPKDEWIDGYLKNCGAKADFFTWHNYASGSASDSNDKVLITQVETIRSMAEGVRRKMSEAKLGAKESFLTEYNISWTWQTRDPRMTNNLGAVFDAQIVLAMAEVGVDGAFVWHFKDGIYGLMDGADRRRPAYDLFRLGAEAVVGDLCSVAVSDEKMLKVAAVRRPDGRRAMLMVNRTDVPLRLKGLEPWAGSLILTRIDAQGASHPVSLHAASCEDLALGPYSIAILSEKTR